MLDPSIVGVEHYTVVHDVQ